MFKRLTILLTLSLIIFLSACTKQKLNRHSKVWYNYFNTVITISLYSENEIPNEDWDILENELKNIEKTFSRTDESSELYKLNQKAGDGPVEVSDNLYYVIEKALEYAKRTGGKFDPTIGPLVEAWGISTENFTVPSEEKIAEAKALVDYKLLKLNEDKKTIELPKAGMIIDLGAIAKGYAADYVGEKVKELGYTTAILNFGGNVLTIGSRPEKNYKKNYNFVIEITKPRKIDLSTGQASDKSTLGNVFVTNKTVVCSGTYERYEVVNGHFYHHILDPDTGYPTGLSKTNFVANDIASVAIITDSSTTADAISTSVFALGLEEGLKLINSLDDVEALFITYDGTKYFSDGFIEKYKFEEN